MPVPVAARSALPPSRLLLPRATQGRRACGRRTSTTVYSFMLKHDSRQLQESVLHFCEAVNSRNLAAMCKLLSDSVVWSDRVWSSMDLVGQRKVQLVHEELFRAYPDYTLHMDTVLARDDANMVALHFTATGTNFGEWRGFPASGRRSTFSGVSLFVFDPERDDLIRQVITYRQPNSEEYAFYLGHEDL